MTRHKPFVLSALFLATFCAAVVWSTDASAQGRAAPRSSGRTTGVAVPRSAGPYPSRPYYGGARYYRPYYRPYYYRPYYSSFYSPFYYPGYYGGFYGSFGWGFGIGYGFGYPYAYGYPYYGLGYGYGYGYGQYPYPYYGPIVYDYSGSARLQVTPRNAQVYIDGYFVGVVDSFDGNLQRLHVEAGEHELQLYLEGHRTFTQKVLFPRGGTLRITHVMQPLGPGESAGPPPKPDESMRATPSNTVSGASGATAARERAIRVRLPAAACPARRRRHPRRRRAVDSATGRGSVRHRADRRPAPDRGAQGWISDLRHDCARAAG